jgi:hypothetical protein
MKLDLSIGFNRLLQEVSWRDQAVSRVTQNIPVSSLSAIYRSQNRCRGDRYHKKIILLLRAIFCLNELSKR